MKKYCAFFQIAALFALALVAPALSSPYYNFYGHGSTRSIYKQPRYYGSYGYSAQARNFRPANFYSAAQSPSTATDLSNLNRIHEAAKPLVKQTEAIAKDIFPNDGAPIVSGGVIRSKFGKLFIYQLRLIIYHLFYIRQCSSSYEQLFGSQCPC